MQAPRRLQLRRGNTAAISTYLGAPGELIINTDTNTLYVHDGLTTGGIATTINTASITSNISSLQSSVAVLQGNILTLESGITTLTSNAAVQAGLLATLLANAGVQSGDIASLLANAGVQAGELATLTSNAASQADSLATLTANAASQSGALADLVANAAVQAGLIASVQGTYGNSNVSAYLTTNLYTTETYVNNQIANISIPETYGNTNVAAYLTTNQYATQPYVNTSNTAVVGYIDNQISTLTANAAVQSGQIASLTSNAAVQAGDITTLFANAGAQADSIATLTSNAATQAGLIASTEANIVVANTALKGYVDSTVTTANTAMKGYVDSQSFYSNVKVSNYLPTYSGNIFADIVSGKLRSNKTAPTTVQGAAGDKVGDIAVDNSYVYICTQDFPTETTYITRPTDTGTSNSFKSNIGYPPPNYITAGWTISGWGISGGTATITGFDDFNGITRFLLNTTISPNYSDYTLNAPAQVNIWTSIPLTSFQSTAYSNAAVSTYLADHTVKTFGGNVQIEGNLFVNGNITSISTNSYTVTDNIISIADGNPADTLDIGFTGHRTVGGALQHTGLIRDASANNWKLFSNVSTSPGTTADFTNAVYDDLVVGAISSPTIDTITANLGSVAGSLATLTSNAGSQAGALATLTSNAASQAGDITTIYANLGAVSGSLATLTSNAAVQAGLLSGLESNAAAQAGAIVTANTAMKGYVDAQIATVTGTYSNSNVASYLTSYTGNIGNVLTTANVVTTQYFIGNGSQLTGIVASAGTTYSNTNVAAYLTTANITTTGNITAAWLSGNISITGNVVGTSPNVTIQAGSYSSTFNNQGNVILPNLAVTGNVISGGYFLGNGALLTGIVAGGGTNYSNVNVAIYLGNVSTNINPVPNDIWGLGAENKEWYSAHIKNAYIKETIQAYSGGGYSGGNAGELLKSTGSGIAWQEIKTVNGNSLFGNGDITISGSSSYGDANVAVYLPTYTGNLGGNLTGYSGNVYLAGNIVVGPAGYTVLPTTVAQFTGNANTYTQLNLQNISTGTDATAEYVATANNSTDTTFFVDLGIANSNYDVNSPTNSLGTAIYANDSYLYAQGNTAASIGGNLVIGTSTASKTVKIFAGGINSANVVATVANTGVSVTGNITASNNITATGNVTATYIVTTGGYGNITQVDTITANSVVATGNVTVQGMGVVMTNRPAFRVNGTSTIAGLQTTANVNLKGAAVSTVYNQGSYFDSTTGKFTAPIAGIYEVLLNARVNSSYNGLQQLVVLKNGLNTAGNIVAFWESGGNTSTSAAHWGVSGTINLVAGDYLSANILAGNVTFDANDNWSVTYLG